MVQQIILGVIIIGCVSYILYRLYQSLFPSKSGKGSKCSSCSSSCVFKDMGIVKENSTKEAIHPKKETSLDGDKTMKNEDN